MLILVAGYQYSGKTEFINLFNDIVKGCNIIYITPNNYEQSLTKALIEESPNTFIIFEIPTIKTLSIIDYIKTINLGNHKICCVFIGTTLKECKLRSNGKLLNREMLEYVENMTLAISNFKKISANFFFIKNSNDPNRTKIKNSIQKVINTTNGTINRIRKPKFILRTINRPGQKKNLHTQTRQGRII